MVIFSSMKGGGGRTCKRPGLSGIRPSPARLFLAALFTAACFIMGGLGGMQAEAARMVIPDTYKYEYEGYRLDIGADTYVSHQWHGISGQVKTSTRRSSVIPDTYGAMLFMVPTVKSGFTYKDCLDINFRNVGWFNGRQLNAQLHVNSVTFGAAQRNLVTNRSVIASSTFWCDRGTWRNGNAWGWWEKWGGTGEKIQIKTWADSAFASPQAGILVIYKSSTPELFFGRQAADQVEFFPGLEQRYDAVKSLTMTLKLTYADNGAAAPVPLKHRVTDIDNNNLWNSYGSVEGVTFGTGYKDNVYVYNNSRLYVNGKSATVPNDGQDHNGTVHYTTPSTGGTNGSNGAIETQDSNVREASMYMNCAWGVTDSSGSSTATYMGGNDSMLIDWHTENWYIPEKQDFINPQNLSSMYWEIDYEMPERYKDVLEPFQSMVFTDVIPAEQNYTSWDLLCNGSSIKSMASGSYNSSNRTLTVSLNQTYLAGTGPYGKTLTLRVYCTWKPDTRNATNTPEVHINGVKFTGRPKPSVNPKSIAIKVVKDVVDKKKSYGKGDIVDFFITVDFSSFPKIPFNYSDADDTESWASKFNFVDNIPAGLEIVGTPKVCHGGLTDRHYTSPWSDVISSQTDAWWAQMYNGFGDIAPTGYPVLFKKDSSGIITDYSGFMNMAKHYYYHPEDDSNRRSSRIMHSFSDFFSNDDTLNARMLEARDVNVGAYGYNVSVTGNKISVSTTGDTLQDWGGNMGHYMQYPYGYEVIGIYYQCRVTGSVIGDLVNTTSVSAENVGIKFFGKKSNGTYSRATIADRYPVSGSDSASISVHGYQVTTEVVNGTITPSVYGKNAGSDVTITYSPKPGHMIQSVTVDGVAQNVNSYKSFYGFTNLQASHHIKVVYAEGYNVVTSVINGTITPSVYGLARGSSKTVTYQPKPGYMLDSVTVDGVEKAIGTYPSSYSFSNITADHKVVVVYRKIPALSITKAVSKASCRPKETMDYTVTVKESVADAYATSVTVSDTLPNGIVLSGTPTAKLSCPGQADATVTVTVSGNTWSCTVPSMSNSSTSGADVLTVTFTGQARGDILGTLRNTAQATASDAPKVTASADTKVIGWIIETEITNGTITPTIREIKHGETKTVSYTPNNDYYVKSVTVDGTPLVKGQLKPHLKDYTFSNIQADHKIVVVCAKNPVITLTKRIRALDTVSKDSGIRAFPFKITGEDYLGDAREYVRVLDTGDSTSATVSFKIPAGEWRVTELVPDGWTMNGIQAGDSCTKDRDTAILDTRNSDRAECVFVNSRTGYKGYVHEDMVVNHLKK